MDLEFVSYATVRDAVGEKRVELAVPDGATVGEALRAFTDQYDGAGPLVFDNDGDIRPNINVLVNEENVALGKGDRTPLSDGDTVTVAPGVSGGTGRRARGRLVGGA